MTENFLDIIRELDPDFPVEALQVIAGGRRWWIPSATPLEFERKKEAIRQDPCRDYRVVARRHKVGVRLVYLVWNEKAG
jgi:hypothetical protein